MPIKASAGGATSIEAKGSALEPTSMQPYFYLAFTPRGVGVVAATFYFVQAENVYGWFIGARNNGCAAGFFALERYYSRETTIYWRSLEDDVHGEWEAAVIGAVTAASGPVPEAIRHELARLQSAFADEWLFFPEYPGAEGEIEAYRKLELPVETVNIRPAQFHRFDQSQPTWIYASPGIDLNVIAYLGDHWMLDHRVTPD